MARQYLFLTIVCRCTHRCHQGNRMIWIIWCIRSRPTQLDSTRLICTRNFNWKMGRCFYIYFPDSYFKGEYQCPFIFIRTFNSIINWSLPVKTGALGIPMYTILLLKEIPRTQAYPWSCGAGLCLSPYLLSVLLTWSLRDHDANSTPP